MWAVSTVCTCTGIYTIISADHITSVKISHLQDSVVPVLRNLLV